MIARAALCALALLAASPALAQAQAEAEAHFERGEALFASENYDAALAEYERAYELLDGHPQAHVLLFNIGQAHERLYRYDRALEYYRRYLDEGGEAAEDRAGVEERISSLEALLGSARIETNVAGAEIWVDDHLIGTAPATVRLTGGPHVVELRAPGHSPARREIQIAAGQRADIDLDLEAQFEGIDPIPFWITTVTAASALVACVVLGSVTLAERTAIHARLNDPVERYGVIVEEESARIRTLANATDAMLATGLTLAVAAVILAAVTDWSPGPTIAPSLGPDHAALVLAGAF